MRTRLLARALGIASISVLAVAASASAAAGAEFALPLVWHAESHDGKVLDSHDAAKAVNPASVVKLATSLRALDTLGPDHRFVTTFGLSGDPAGAHGSLVVEGGADPDFHFENAVVVARALEQAGVRHLRGDLYVGPTFWIGWERGTAGREPDPDKRRFEMGRRLLAAWSPSSWSADQKQAWAALAARRRWDAAKPPAVRIDGRVRIDGPPAARAVVVHRSQPLLVALRRFNVFSNNDIERLDASVGPAPQLASFLQKRFGEVAAGASFSTSSGLNRNRMSPRLVVRMLHDLRAWLSDRGRRPGDLMPVLGCGDSTLRELFPRLRESGEANGLAGKTGTLNTQDGGVSALAGYLPAGPGVVFFVAAPGAGAALPKARAVQEDWVRRMLKKVGPVPAVDCPPPVPTSDELVEISGDARITLR